MRLIDLTNKQYGFLKVIKQGPRNSSNRVSWYCECDCGKIVLVTSNNIRSGNTVSCGCQSKRINREKKIKSLINFSFGKLKVVEYDEKNSIKKGETYWKCKCDCGRVTSVRAVDLQNKKTKSCGLCIKSHGELKINKILLKDKISFIPNYRELNCKLQSGGFAIFDFAVINSKGEILYFIEYDGQQHFLKEKRGFYTKEKIQKIQLSDRIKNEYCLKNLIPLIRIPYTHFKDLSVKDLILKENNFIIKGENKQ